MAKYEYKLIIDKEPTRGHKYFLNYGSTRDIRLTLAKDAVAIHVGMTVRKDPETILSAQDKLFAHVLKKAMLLHLILYSANLKFKVAFVHYNDNVKEFPFHKLHPPVFSLADGALLRPFPKNWNDQAFIQCVLDQPKTRQGSLMSALYALTCSKTKQYRAERFFNLWMAINGVYGFFSELAVTQNLVILKGNRPEPEGDQIKRFLQVTGLGREHISQASRETICQQVMSILIKHDGIISSQSLDGGDSPDELAGKIRSALIQPDGKGTFDLTAKGFVMMELGYQLRCQLFHANKPLPLFSFADERELVFLKIVSDLLEEYLDQELYRLFDPKYVTERILPVIEKTAVKKK